MGTNNATNTSYPLTVAQNGTGASSFTAYSVITAGTTSTGAFQNVSGVGTAGQVLVSSGAGALPVWGSYGTWVKLSSQTASSSASLTFTSLISSTYSTYALLFSDVLPVTNNTTIQITVSTDNGSSYITSNYQSGINYQLYNAGTVFNSNSTSAGLLTAGIDNTSSRGGAVGIAFLHNVTNGAPIIITGQFAGYVNGNGESTSPIYTYNTATNVNAFKIAMSSGNISRGTFTLYGILE